MAVGSKMRSIGSPDFNKKSSAKCTAFKIEVTMRYKTILFDLDGTLLPMDQDVFVKTYFGMLAKTLAPRGYEPEKLIKAVWSGTGAMVKNDGSKLNEQAFWDRFCEIFGESARADEPHFARFYEEVFDNVRVSCGHTPKAAEVISALKKSGATLALATNPIFPAIATEKRIAWAGLCKDDFKLYTTYENSHYCKPSLKYYEEILEKLGVDARDCLMVGNDVSEDMVAHKLGMDVFLLTNCLINKNGEDISLYPSGSFDDLLEYVK